MSCGLGKARDSEAMDDPRRLEAKAARPRQGPLEAPPCRDHPAPHRAGLARPVRDPLGDHLRPTRRRQRPGAEQQSARALPQQRRRNRNPETACRAGIRTPEAERRTEPEVEDEVEPEAEFEPNRKSKSSNPNRNRSSRRPRDRRRPSHLLDNQPGCGDRGAASSPAPRSASGCCSAAAASAGCSAATPRRCTRRCLSRPGGDRSPRRRTARRSLPAPHGPRNLDPLQRRLPALLDRGRDRRGLGPGGARPLLLRARLRIGAARWRSLHRLTAVFWLLGLVHTFGAGTDAGQLWFLLAVAAPTVPALVLLRANSPDSGSAPRCAGRAPTGSGPDGWRRRSALVRAEREVTEARPGGETLSSVAAASPTPSSPPVADEHHLARLEALQLVFDRLHNVLVADPGLRDDPALASAATVVTRFFWARWRAPSTSEAQRSRNPIRAGASTRTSPSPRHRQARRGDDSCDRGRVVDRAGDDEQDMASPVLGQARRSGRAAVAAPRRRSARRRQERRGQPRAPGPPSQNPTTIGTTMPATISGSFQGAITLKLSPSAGGASLPPRRGGPRRGGHDEHHEADQDHDDADDVVDEQRQHDSDDDRSSELGVMRSPTPPRLAGTPEPFNTAFGSPAGPGDPDDSGDRSARKQRQRDVRTDACGVGHSTSYNSHETERCRKYPRQDSNLRPTA